MTNERVLTAQQLRQYRDRLTIEIQDYAELRGSYLEDDDNDQYFYYDGVIFGIKAARSWFDKMLEGV